MLLKKPAFNCWFYINSPFLQSLHWFSTFVGWQGVWFLKSTFLCYLMLPQLIWFYMMFTHSFLQRFSRISVYKRFKHYTSISFLFIPSFLFLPLLQLSFPFFRWFGLNQHLLDTVGTGLNIGFMFLLFCSLIYFYARTADFKT